MIKVKLLTEKCEPVKAHRWDAGWDLKSAVDTFTIEPNQVVKVHTGVCIEIPIRHAGYIMPRSGLGTKNRITLVNDIGVIDSDYRGELIVNIINKGSESYTIQKFDRFAQLVIAPINCDVLRVVSRLSETGRGDGGFGSTDKSKEELSQLTPAAYYKLKTSGELKQKYPSATGVMLEDLELNN